MKAFSLILFTALISGCVTNTPVTNQPSLTDIISKPSDFSSIHVKKNVQSYLQSLGYYKAKIDGVFGPKSKSALRNFESDAQIVVDGIIDLDSIRLMESVLHMSAPAPSNRPLSNQGYNISASPSVRGVDNNSLRQLSLLGSDAEQATKSTFVLADKLGLNTRAFKNLHDSAQDFSTLTRAARDVSNFSDSVQTFQGSSNQAALQRNAMRMQTSERTLTEETQRLHFKNQQKNYQQALKNSTLQEAAYNNLDLSHRDQVRNILSQLRHRQN